MKAQACPNTISNPVVVVVDDDEDTRLNLRDILELDGYRVEDVGTAHDLYSRKAWDDVALVLLDRKLPDGTPQEVLPRVKRQAPHVAVIIVTGYSDIEGAILAMRSGAADYILKPVNTEALRASVLRVLEHQRSEREIARLHRAVVRGEERYRSLFENTLDGLLILDNGRRVVDANPAACSQLGYERTAICGQPFASLAVPTDGAPQADLWSRIFGAGKQMGECRLVRAGGTIIDVEYRAVEGVSPGLHLLSIQNITARKRAEERARQSERLAAIGETMASLVHESRNALQRSRACLEMLSFEVEDRPAALDLVARANRAQNDLHQLFEEVRQWSAPVHLHKTACNLQSLWKEVWQQVVPQQAGTVRLLEEVGCDPTCFVDRFAMGQVIRNIFENAVEVSPPGSAVSLRCWNESANGRDEIRIVIQDEGPGLSQDQQARIFEPFFTTKAKGTGLGMAIVQRIVHSHDGTIHARSSQGAQIEICLPRGPA